MTEGIEQLTERKNKRLPEAEQEQGGEIDVVEF